MNECDFSGRASRLADVIALICEVSDVAKSWPRWDECQPHVCEFFKRERRILNTREEIEAYYFDAYLEALTDPT